MRKEQLEKLKENPEKYRQYRDKINRYRKEKLDIDPEFRKKKNEYQRKYMQKMKIERPDKYKEKLKQLYEYQTYGKGRENRLKSQTKYREKKRLEPDYKEKHNAYMKEYRRIQKLGLEVDT